MSPKSLYTTPQKWQKKCLYLRDIRTRDNLVWGGDASQARISRVLGCGGRDSDADDGDADGENEA